MAMAFLCATLFAGTGCSSKNLHQSSGRMIPLTSSQRLGGRKCTQSAQWSGPLAGDSYSAWAFVSTLLLLQLALHGANLRLRYVLRLWARLFLRHSISLSRDG